MLYTVICAVCEGRVTVTLPNFHKLAIHSWSASYVVKTRLWSNLCTRVGTIATSHAPVLDLWQLHMYYMHKYSVLHWFGAGSSLFLKVLSICLYIKIMCVQSTWYGKGSLRCEVNGRQALVAGYFRHLKRFANTSQLGNCFPIGWCFQNLWDGYWSNEVLKGAVRGMWSGSLRSSGGGVEV